MKGKKFTEEQIIRVLKEAEGGLKVTDLCRQHGIAEATYYRWKSKYGGLEVSEAKRLRALEEENRRLSPNPPMDPDGGREDSGRGVRELQAR